MILPETSSSMDAFVLLSIFYLLLATPVLAIVGFALWAVARFGTDVGATAKFALSAAAGLAIAPSLAYGHGVAVIPLVLVLMGRGISEVSYWSLLFTPLTAYAALRWFSFVLNDAQRRRKTRTDAT